MIRKEKPNQILFFFKVIEMKLSKEEDEMFNLFSVSPSNHQGCIWSSLKDFGFLPAAQQNLELWFCDMSQAVFWATVILLWCAKLFYFTHFEEENHLSELF